VQQVLHAADHAAHDLDVLAHVLTHLERERFESPRLASLRRALDREGVTASRAIRQLHRLAEMHDWQHNQFFAPLGAFVLWGTHIAHAMERWRARHGAEVRGWLDVVGEFEAFGSLSAYRFEHPADVFPELLEPGPAAYEGEALAHPLLPAARAVRNNVRLSGETRLLVVSGSNMSGKSTLLRTVGINAVLAYAGAPVRAARLRLTPLAPGATLRIQDSLQEGRSRFFAEITRIRGLADVARGQTPLLFLLDELFHGTNSHDRLVGATGVLRSLLDRGAIGLITTHDLALTRIADDLAPHAANVHFEDTFEDGEVRFDYRMKPGPVARSNALALMRAVGLDVDP
jgi:DNA mismatch repair ATPase MutS